MGLVGSDPEGATGRNSLSIKFRPDNTFDSGPGNRTFGNGVMATQLVLVQPFKVRVLVPELHEGRLLIVQQAAFFVRFFATSVPGSALDRNA